MLTVVERVMLLHNVDVFSEVPTEELAFLALSLPAQRPAPPPAVAGAFLDHLDELGAALTGHARTPTGAPVLPDHPRTVAAAAALTTAVADIRAVK